LAHEINSEHFASETTQIRCAAPTSFPTFGGVTLTHIGGTMRLRQKVTFAEMHGVGAAAMERIGGAPMSKSKGPAAGAQRDLF
jgi:hypothetical protein